MRARRSAWSVRFLPTLAALALAWGCAGGGGGGQADDAEEKKPPNVTGTGAGGVPIFWLSLGDPELGSGGASVPQTSDGGYLAAGALSGGVYLVKLDALGAKQWERSFPGGSPDASDTAARLRPTSDGGYVVAGLHRVGSGNAEVHSFYLLRVDASGQALPGWPRTYGGGSPEHGGAYDVLESQDQAGKADGFVLVGVSADHRAMALKVGLDGAELWRTALAHDPAGGRDTAGAVVQDPADGALIVAGSVQQGGTPDHLRVARLDRGGAVVAGWTRTYGIGSALAIRRTGDGGFVLAGTTSGGSPDEDGDALVLKLDAQGDEAWRRTLGGGRDDRARSIVPLDGGAGGYLLAGTSASFSQPDVNEVRMSEVLLARLDASGNPIWEKVKGIDPLSPDGASEVQATSDGGCVLVGSSQGYFLVMKADANGDTVNVGPNDLTVTVTAPGTLGSGNAFQVARASLAALDDLREVGAFGLDTLLAVRSDPSLNGKNGLTISPAPATLAAEQSYSFTLSQHVTSYSGDQATLDGSFTLGITALNGSLAGDHTAALTVTALQLSHTDDTGKVLAFQGSVAYTRTVSGASKEEVSQPGPSGGVSLASGPAGSPTLSETVEAFTIHRSEAGGSFSLGRAGDAAQLEVDGVAGTLALSVAAPITGSVGDPVHPGGGRLAIKAGDGSTVTLMVGAGGAITLAIDTDADGTVDASLTTTFDDLG